MKVAKRNLLVIHPMVRAVMTEGRARNLRHCLAALHLEHKSCDRHFDFELLGLEARQLEEVLRYLETATSLE